METKSPTAILHQAILERDEILREVGINRNPIGMRFMLVGDWKCPGEDEDRVVHSHVEGTVTGFSIDQTERTAYKKGLSLVVDQPFIFDMDLLCLVPKDPTKNLWTALFYDSADDPDETPNYEADVLVFFDNL